MPKDYNLEIISPGNFDAAVADELTYAISDSIEEQGSCRLVASGGKTPAGVYRLLSRPPRVQDIDWGNLKVFLGDERYVPLDHVGSNYKLIEETLLRGTNIPKENVFNIDTSKGSANESAQAYNEKINQDFAVKEKVFDVVLLGVGTNGHIASLFPNSKPEVTGLTCVSSVKEEPKERISLTPEALFAAKKIYFIVKGSNKTEIISKIFGAETDQVSEFPALNFHNSPAKVTWFIDAEAGKQL